MGRGRSGHAKVRNNTFVAGMRAEAFAEQEFEKRTGLSALQVKHHVLNCPHNQGKVKTVKIRDAEEHLKTCELAQQEFGL